MKIKDVRVHIISRRGQAISCLMEVESADGVTGIGEADGDGFHTRNGEFCVAMKHVVENGYRDFLVGENPADYRMLWERMRSYSWLSETGIGMAAISGIDIALMDLAGKALGVPAYSLLGGRYRDRVRVYASHPWMTPETHEECCRELRELAEKGFTAVKVSFARFKGFGENLEVDIQYVKEARDAIGYGMEMAMSDYAPPRSVSRAVMIARRLEEYDLLFWEDALPRGDVEGYTRLSEAVDLPIEAGEEMTVEMLRHYIKCHAVDVINPDICQHGGLSEAKRIADLAQAMGIRHIPHSYGSAVSIAANIHLTAAMPDNDLMEYRVSQPDPSMTELLKEPLVVEKGCLPVPEKPGLGVELDRKTLERIRWERD